MGWYRIARMYRCNLYQERSENNGDNVVLLTSATSFISSGELMQNIFIFLNVNVPTYLFRLLGY